MSIINSLSSNQGKWLLLYGIQCVHDEIVTKHKLDNEVEIGIFRLHQAEISFKTIWTKWSKNL